MDLKVGNVVCPAEKYGVCHDRADRHYDGEKHFSIRRNHKELSQYLTANGKAFSDLNDNPSVNYGFGGNFVFFTEISTGCEKYCSGVLLY